MVDVLTAAAQLGQRSQVTRLAATCTAGWRESRWLGAPDAETYYWAPGHNLEVVTDVEYFEISKIDDYDVLMDHCRRGLAAAAEAAE
jgi:hypothetical protein